MKKAAVIGHFAKNSLYLDGQTVKTKIVTQELCEHYGAEEILAIDSNGWSKNAVTLFSQIVKGSMQAEHILMLPAQNGLRIIAPLLYFLRQGRNCHYIVIGGWLPGYIRNTFFLKRILRNFAGVYVETSAMKKALEEQGFYNIVVLPNCKNLVPLTPQDLQVPEGEPFKLCTFSRVMKEKGIEDAVNAVIAVNTQLERTAYVLDIYGQIAPSQEEWFSRLQADFPPYICYQGAIPYDQSVDTLRGYFALLFPTRYYTEGIPGTIIDAYAAGLPVISSMWENYGDILDAETGIGYSFDNPDELKSVLLTLAENNSLLVGKKKACLSRANDFLPPKVMRILVDRMEHFQ